MGGLCMLFRKVKIITQPFQRACTLVQSVSALEICVNLLLSQFQILHHKCFMCDILEECLCCVPNDFAPKVVSLVWNEVKLARDTCQNRK